jgi:hypothetical protein
MTDGRIDASGEETMTVFGYNAARRNCHANSRLDSRSRQQISPFSSNVDRQPGGGIELWAAASLVFRDGRADHRRTGSGRCCAGNLLIVDLFPPNRGDPQGIHKVIWDRLRDEPFALPPDKPLTLAAYAAGPEIVAYIEPVAVGDILPDRPIFLTPGTYVNCPLEVTYEATWSVFPAVLKAPLERPGEAPETA